MEILRITINANELKRFERAGRYMEIISSTGAVDIDLYNKDGGDVDGATGALSGLFMEGDFASFNIKSTTTQTVELLITEGRGGSRRQPGNVRVIDTSQQNTIDGKSFYDYGYISSADATKFAVVQIFNPGSSGVRAAIKSIQCSLATVGVLNIALVSTAEATNRGAVRSKLAGGAVGKCLIKTGSTNTVVPAASAQAARYANAKEQIKFEPDDPFVLIPGTGISIWADLQATPCLIFSEFDVIEEPI